MAEQQITVRFRARTSQLEQGARNASRGLDRVEQSGERASRVGRTMTRRVTPAVAAVGAAATTAGMDFESSMLNVQAISGETGATLDQMSDQARELGQTTQFSAGQAADGLGYLAMAGMDADDAMQALPHTLDLAAASGMELARSADLASNVLQQFALDAEETDRVTDVMAETSRNANTSVEQLGGALEMAGPIANAAGIDLEETAAAIGAMSDAGIQGTTAGTSLRQALSQLTNASGPAADTLEELGINAEAADGSIRPMPDIIDELGEAGADAGDLMQIFGQRAGPAMAALVEQGGDALRDLEVDLRDSAGAAAEMAETRMAGLEGSLQELRSALSEAGIAIFDSGLGDGLEAAADAAAGATRAFANLPDGVQRTMVVAGGAAAAVGPLASSVGYLARNARRLVGVMGLLNPKIAAASAVAGVLGAAYGALTSDTVDQVEAEQAFAQALSESEGAMNESVDSAIAKRVEDEGLIESANELGLETRDLVDAIKGEEDARRRVQGVLDEQIDDSTRMGNSMTDEERASRELEDALDDLGPAFEDMRREVIRDELDEMGVSLADLDDGLRDTVLGAEDVEAALEALPPHMRPVAEEGDAVEDVLRDVEEASDDASDSFDTLRQAMDEVRGAAVDLEEAHRDVLESIDTLTERVDENSGTLDINSEAGRENRAALQETAESIWDKVEAVYEETGSVDEATSAANRHYDALLDEAEAAGISRSAAEEYIDELNLIPEDVETALELYDDEAHEDRDRYEGALDELPDRVDTDVEADTEQAESNVSNFQSSLDSIPSTRTVTVRTRRAQASANDSEAQVFHSGGIVGQTSAPTRAMLPLERLAANEVPAVLERGEVVLPRDANLLAVGDTSAGSAPRGESSSAGGDSALAQGELRAIRRLLQSQQRESLVTAMNRADRLTA